jgi:AcrR family transcriptional regulator
VSRPRLSVPGSARERVDGRRVRGEATREQILDAAREVIREDGYSAATMRTVAEAAGVQLSLVHYHFGGKRQLLTALLEHENERLLGRQRALYAGDEPLAEKWLQACRYLGEDLRSGYVRVLWELWATGLAEPELAARWRGALLSWIDLLEEVAGAWAGERALELPVPPRVLATLVANAFLGAEAQLLAGMDERDVPNVEALEACAALIEQAERAARP